MYESLVGAIVEDPWFVIRPTPVLAIPGMSFTYFLVRPPLPHLLLSDETRVLPDGTALPLPPSALSSTATSWLVSPDETGGVLLLGDELADLIQSFERKSA